MEVKLELEIDGIARTKIEDVMSTAAGEYIEAVGNPNMSEWTPEEWGRFIAIMFDMCATQVFSKRIIIVGPNVMELPF